MGVSSVEWIGIGLLGGAGAVLRYGVSAAVTRHHVESFPWGTLVVNLSGAFVLGMLHEAALSSSVQLLIGTATIGAYTTFSTWMRETYHLGHTGRRTQAVLNVVGSITFGLIAYSAGRAVGWP